MDQRSLFDGIYVPPHRFPTNAAPNAVGKVVDADLARSSNPLIIAGYASIDRLVGRLASLHQKATQSPGSIRARILIGNEPRVFGAELASRPRRFSQEIADYWLAQGISVYLSGDLISAIEFAKSQSVELRCSDQTTIHAKMYVTEDAVTLGSSNYTKPGMERQIEANARFSTDEPQRLAEAKGLAEEIWSLGRDFRDEFIALLEQLLQCVTWKEALARGCAELLEGHWATWLMPKGLAPDDFRLWPSQEQGIAQALWVLENQGSVLLADATGSGKTLLGAHLIRRVMTRLARTGRGRSDLAVLMVPPSVRPDWERHAANCDAPVRSYSQGHLSTSGTQEGDVLRTAIRRAQVLAIDEAHNFLRRSKRTTALFSNLADHVILFTATPVNRGPRDMLAMIDLLGADNLDDETLGVLSPLWKRPSRHREHLAEEEMKRLREGIRRFTVRRTKAELNELVSRDPESYRLGNGRTCRYPKHEPITYPCEETARDVELAMEIRHLAAGLKGLTRLKGRFELTEGLRRTGFDEETYLASRLRGASALAAHEVASSLRSSKVRLLEHIVGTANVLTDRQDLAPGQIPNKKGAIQSIEVIAGRIPESTLSISLPPYLRDVDAHREACNVEIQIYEHIQSRLGAMSDGRERAKVALIQKAASRHRLVLAFDSYLITLADLRQRLKTSPGWAKEIVLATGKSQTGKRRLYKTFRPESGESAVGLCSDALSEGVNLQGASAVIMLDMPSVIRVAEQRIGRVDRMNSPHDVIEAYWPIDHPAFALRANERLVARSKFVADHLGSNLTLPPEIGGDEDRVITVQEVTTELEASSSGSEIADALSSVRSLVAGNTAVIPTRLYEQIRRSQTRVVSSVSVVSAATDFVFLAIAGTTWGAPKWVWIAGMAAPITDLDDICRQLRSLLTPEVRDLRLDARSSALFKAAVARLEQSDELLLPKGKQRALEELRHVIKKYRADAPKGSARESLLSKLADLIAPSQRESILDKGALADWWLRVIQPVKLRHLTDKARNRPLLLKSLRKDLRAIPLDDIALESVFDEPLSTKPLDQRVVAAIIGVSDAGVSQRS